MTNTEWQELQKHRARIEKMQRVSKTIGNALRYRAFTEHNQNGLESAKRLLEEYIEKIGEKDVIYNEGLGKIKKGIIAELRFFDSCRECFSLCPTLDAGCAFDFIGKVPEGKIFAPLGFGGQFIRIDVTTSIDCKRNKEIVSNRGQKHWPLLFAYVHDNKLDWYTEKLENSLLSNSLELNKVPFSGERKSHHVAFVRYRRECLERIEFGDRLDEVVREILDIDGITPEERKALEAQAVFFATYKYALNIVPALSYGDLCDFIGEHDGELVKFRILTEIKRYFKDEYPIIEPLKNKFRYKIALFDAQTKMFTFHDWDDCQLFDDIPDLGEILN